MHQKLCMSTDAVDNFCHLYKDCHLVNWSDQPSLGPPLDATLPLTPSLRAETVRACPSPDTCLSQLSPSCRSPCENEQTPVPVTPTDLLTINARQSHTVSLISLLTANPSLTLDFCLPSVLWAKRVSKF